MLWFYVWAKARIVFAFKGKVVILSLSKGIPCLIMYQIEHINRDGIPVMLIDYAYFFVIDFLIWIDAIVNKYRP